MLRTKILPFCPQYIWHSGLDVKPGLLAEVAKLVDDGSMKVVLNPISPLSFTELDVKSGFHISTVPSNGESLVHNLHWIGIPFNNLKILNAADHPIIIIPHEYLQQQ